MAIQIKNTYSGRTDNTDPNYPFGKGRNVVGGVEGTGTPFEADWYNNLEGFLQGLLLEADITPDGNVDNANSSQLVEAVKGLEKSADKVNTKTDESVQDFIDTFSLKIFQSPTDGELTEIQTRTINGGEVYEVRKASDDSLATIYSYAAGTTEITQNGTDNKSGSDGAVEFYITDGDYYVEVNGVKSYFSNSKGFADNTIKRSFTSKALKNKSSFYWGGTGVNIMGDSISHGAFSRDIFENNWTNIFKRCFNAEYDSDNYGFVNLWDQLGTGGLASQEIHQVSISNFTFRSQDDGSLAIIGSEYESNSGDGSSVVTVDVPSFLPEFGVWYRRVDGGGSFDIEVNGSVIATINTDAAGGAAGGYFLARGYTVADNGKGLCNIRLIAKTTAKVYLMGMSYESDADKSSVNNLSTSGRRLAKASRDVILRSVAGCQTLIMALGHNDAGDAEVDGLYYEAFKQRIDWLIEDCNTYGVPVIVPDFNWTSPDSYRVRSELKRLASSVDSGVYISFPELFKANGDVPDQNYIINTAELFDDASHPNVEGHKIIGETIAKVMGLSCSSKKESLLFHDWWRVFKIPDATPIKNSLTDSRYSFAYKRNGGSLIVRGSFSNTDTPPPAQMPAGVFDVTEGETGLYFLNNDVKAFKTSPFTLDTYAYLQPVSATGNIKLHVKGSSGLSTANAAIVLSDY